MLAKNQLLRQQLEESHRTNISLTNDLHKLTVDWDHMRTELNHKEDEWKEEEQAFNDYYNSEQNRLIEMWQDVGSIRRSFKDLQSSLRSELHRMQQDITHTSRDIAGTAGFVAENERIAMQNQEACQAQSDRIIHDLQSQIEALKSMNESSKHELAQREQRLHDAMADMRMLESRCGEAENQAAMNHRLNDEIERLATALRDIAHVVVHDAESTDGVLTDAHHLHLSQAIGMPPKSPKRCAGGVRTSQAFAEGTISAVQAVLHKYQLVIHDLSVKIQAHEDELHASKKQSDAAEGAREILTAKLVEMTEKLDAMNNKYSELSKERASLQRSLEGIRNEKHLIEKDKAELKLVVDNVTSECEQLQAAKGNLQKAIDQLTEEKKLLGIDVQCSVKDKEMMEMNLR